MACFDNLIFLQSSIQYSIQRRRFKTDCHAITNASGYSYQLTCKNARIFIFLPVFPRLNNGQKIIPIIGYPDKRIRRGRNRFKIIYQKFLAEFNFFGGSGISQNPWQRFKTFRKRYDSLLDVHFFKFFKGIQHNGIFQPKRAGLSPAKS